MIAISNKEQVYAGMVNWQVTAATIYCDAVDDEVTLLVYKDGSTKCTGYKKYGKPDKETAEVIEKNKQLKRRLECEGPEYLTYQQPRREQAKLDFYLRSI